MRLLSLLVVIVTASAGTAFAYGPTLALNGRLASARELQILAQLERRADLRLPGGSYWYDNRSGAFGRMGEPTLAVIGAGLRLGGPLPARASAGDTGVFINGRELHRLDVMRLHQARIPVQRGRWWVDGRGDFGREGRGRMGNLMALSGGGGGKGRPWTKRIDMNTGRSRDNINMASDGRTTCVSTASRTICTDGRN